MVFEFINIYAYTEFFITWQDTVLVGFSCRSIIIKGRNTLILRISPLLHKFPRRTRKTGYGVDGDRRPSAVRLDDRQSPGLARVPNTSTAFVTREGREGGF